MTDDNGSPRPAWAVSSLADALTALRAELLAGTPATATEPRIEVADVTAEFSVDIAPDAQGELRLWVVAADQPGTPDRTARHRIALTLACAPSVVGGAAPPSGLAESTRGWDDSVPYGIPNAPAEAGTSSEPRGWDEGDRP